MWSESWNTVEPSGRGDSAPVTGGVEVGTSRGSRSPTTSSRTLGPARGQGGHRVRYTGPLGLDGRAERSEVGRPGSHPRVSGVGGVPRRDRRVWWCVSRVETCPGWSRDGPTRPCKEVVPVRVSRPGWCAQVPPQRYGVPNNYSLTDHEGLVAGGFGLVPPPTSGTYPRVRPGTPRRV